MPVNDKIHGYVAYAHPLAQIEAAETWHGFSTAMVVDEWELFFEDEAPDEEDVPTPEMIIDALAHTGLRFESMGPEDEDHEGFWREKYRSTRMNILLYGWAYQVLDALGVDPRIFWHGLYGTELIFVPDYEKVVLKARDLLKEVARNAAYVEKRETQEEEYLSRVHRKHDFPAAKPVNRGEGPREKKLAIVDRIAIALRDAGKPLTPEEVAAAIKHKNAASIAAALHQIVAYKKPKRLSGWIQRNDQGRYRWAAKEASANASDAG